MEVDPVQDRRWKRLIFARVLTKQWSSWLLDFRIIIFSFSESLQLAMRESFSPWPLKCKQKAACLVPYVPLNVFLSYAERVVPPQLLSGRLQGTFSFVNRSA